jgi:uncharacterized membrane protein
VTDSTAPGRRTYLDVLRGVAVLVMIEAHVIDSWTRAADRRSRAFGESMILGGFGAPLFLFLAGVAVAMSAGAKARRTGDTRAAVRAVQRRGLEIFLLAFVFRFQSFVLSFSPAWAMLKVDILNIMGPSIILAATLWGGFRTSGARIIAFATATLVVVWATPIIRQSASLAVLSDPLEGYLRPIPNLTNFTFFPWMGFVTAGALVGVVLDAARSLEADRKVNLGFGVAGLVLAVAAYQASFLPPLGVSSSFWTTSASFFFIRLGLMVAALGLAYLWEQRPTLRPFDRLRVVPSNVEGRPGSGQAAGRGWSPLQLLGRSSLFVYWVHVELVYGVISKPLHGAFSLRGAWIGLFLFVPLMVAMVVGKDRWMKRWRGDTVNRYKTRAYFRSSAGGVKP